MKISRLLIENVLPNTIGAFLFIGYFVLKDHLSNQAELESCEIYYVSNPVYVVFILSIALLSSLYQILIGKWILKRKEWSVALNLANSFVYATFFSLTILLIQLLNRDSIDVQFSGIIFLGLLILAMLNWVIKAVLFKLLRNRLTY